MTSPNSYDYDRIAQKIFELDGDKIFDEQDFNDSFDAYMMQNTEISDRLPEKESIKKRSWKYYSKNSKLIPRSARKRLEEGYTKQEKFVRIRKEKKTGVVRVGKRKAVPLYKGGKIKHNFTILGKIKNRTVYTRKIRTKKGIAYVDRLGRRASVKKKKLHKTKKVNRKRHRTKS